MRSWKMVLLAVCVLGLAALAVAGQNQFGVADSRNVKFSAPIRVGDVLLPQGEYQVLHNMQGDEHIMVFKQLNARKPLEVRAKCKLVPLSMKASQNEQAYTMNAANERVLQRLVFKGDTAQHVF